MALDTFNPYLFVSSGEQSNKFLTPTYANGIAKFQAQRAQSITGLTVRIDPIQEGTGDPSPDNIRPISGRTGLTVTAAGKNVLSLVESEMISTGWNRLFPISLKAGTYIISCQHQFGVSAKPGCQVELMDEDNIFVKYLWGTYAFGNSVFVGSPVELTEEEAKKIKFILFKLKAGGGTYNDIVSGNIQLELGTSATAYEPYDGQTYPISWQTEAGTVYGGTLDVVSGVLTVDRAMATFDGSSDEYWYYYSIATGNMFRITIADRISQIITSYPDNYACNSYHVAPNVSTGRTNGTFSGSTYNVDFVDDRYSTLEDWRAALAQTPIQFLYPLATPQTYRLTGTEVRTLAGYNQIYSDAGPVIDIKF